MLRDLDYRMLEGATLVEKLNFIAEWDWEGDDIFREPGQHLIAHSILLVPSINTRSDWIKISFVLRK